MYRGGVAWERFFVGKWPLSDTTAYVERVEHKDGTIYYKPKFPAHREGYVYFAIYKGKHYVQFHGEVAGLFMKIPSRADKDFHVPITYGYMLDIFYSIPGNGNFEGNDGVVYYFEVRKEEADIDKAIKRMIDFITAMEKND